MPLFISLSKTAAERANFRVQYPREKNYHHPIRRLFTRLFFRIHVESMINSILQFDFYTRF